jgi:omega-6 fatty acid desaturase (delta-12 desaturase)
MQKLRKGLDASCKLLLRKGAQVTSVATQVMTQSLIKRTEPAPAPIPHRKVIRGWLQPVSQRNTALALALVTLDLALFAAAIGATVLFHNAWIKLLAGAGAGLVIARLFILGHDACHQSFTASRNLNRWLGRLVFLPSLTPYSLWDVGHNVVHHGYTNLKGFDFVWEPLTREQYAAMPPWRRALERVYRSGWAPWLYYLVEVWWRKMFFPSRRSMPTRRAAFRWDCLLVSAAALAWIGFLAWAAHATAQSLWLTELAGFVLPFIVWNGFIGFVVYVHHTHAGIAWYSDKGEWSAAQPFVSTTVHLMFRSFLGVNMGGLLHQIMEHTAHHVDMGIPLYRLKQAQKILESKLQGRIVIQHFSWCWYFDTARRCKLYDYAARCWTDFAGRPTTQAVSLGT